MVYLPERRCDLVALLVSPPSPHVAGQLVPDDLVIARLWPGQSRTRADLNTVIHRVRADLLRGELDGARLVERAEGGGATRFDADAATRVTIV
jgi:DNA-binding winged helix-turn-helix (wHTH) protein